MENVARKIYICLGTTCTLPAGNDSDQHERHYQRIYKPLISSLYTLERIPFTLFLTGPFLEWMEHNHPEFFMLTEELLARKQIDVLGGGYYDPLFPLIPPADRVGQVELLTTSIRKYFGKRPRGAWISASAWEPSLVSTFCTCGIEYVLVDKIMLATSGFPGVDGLSPAVLEDAGKTITAIPLDNHFRNLERFTPESFLDEIRGKGKGRDKGKDSILTVFINPLSIPALFCQQDGAPSWFEQLLELSAKLPMLELSLTGRVYRPKEGIPRAYLAGGMSPYDHDDVPDPVDVRVLARTSVKKYLLENKNTHTIYAKMMHVHVLVNQLRGDKARKKNAREELWQSQQNEVFRPIESADSQHSRSLRASAYKHLLIAEKLSRVRGVFSPSIIASDFDMDTQKEYLCQLDRINAYVHLRGGRVFELDVFSVYRNYCDLCDDSGGLFVDHVFAQDDLDRLESSGELPAQPVFSNSTYQDVSFDSSRHEVFLRAHSTFGQLQQPLSLKKQYSFRNEGLQVQYILKNESPLALSAYFACELGLSLSKNRHKMPLMTVYTQDTRKDCEIERSFFRDVAWVQIADSGSLVTFTLEANENPSVSILPVQCGDKPASPDGVRVFLYWKVELGPGFETEKTVFAKIDS